MNQLFSWPALLTALVAVVLAFFYAQPMKRGVLLARLSNFFNAQPVKRDAPVESPKKKNRAQTPEPECCVAKRNFTQITHNYAPFTTWAFTIEKPMLDCSQPIKETGALTTAKKMFEDEERKDEEACWSVSFSASKKAQGTTMDLLRTLGRDESDRPEGLRVLAGSAAHGLLQQASKYGSLEAWCKGIQQNAKPNFARNAKASSIETPRVVTDLNFLRTPKFPSEFSVPTFPSEFSVASPSPLSALPNETSEKMKLFRASLPKNGQLKLAPTPQTPAFFEWKALEARPTAVSEYDVLRETGSRPSLSPQEDQEASRYWKMTDLIPFGGGPSPRTPFAATSTPSPRSQINAGRQSSGSDAGSAGSKAKGELKFRVIPHDEKWRAQRLLYEVYVEEMGWDLSKQTPNLSDIRAEHDTRLLTSRFDDVAVWFGCFDGKGELLMCMRCLPEEPLGFEIEQSIDADRLEAWRERAGGSQSSCWEMARIAKARHARKMPLLSKFWSEISKHLLIHHGADFLILSPPSETVQLHTKSGYNVIEGSEFMYSENDPSPCVFMWATPESLIRAAVSKKSRRR